jgi:hypothetical protein
VQRLYTSRKAIYFSSRIRPPEAHLILNGWKIPFVNHVKYLGVTFNKRITWGLHTEMIEAKTCRTFSRIYSLFKSKCLSANIKLILHKALIGSEVAVTYLDCSASKTRFWLTTANFPWRTPVRDSHRAFNLPYAYDYATKLCKQETEVIQNHDNGHVSGIRQCEARHRKYKRLKHGGDQAHGRSSD